MQINLFTCTAEHNRVDKTPYIGNRFTISGTLKSGTSVTKIRIEIEKTNPVAFNYNYMYIEEFGRYYFIDDIENISNRIWRISAHVDVLMSFRSDILGANAIINKIENESAANTYLDDGSFVMDTRKYNQIKEFPSGLNENGTYILICAGGT